MALSGGLVLVGLALVLVATSEAPVDKGMAVGVAVAPSAPWEHGLVGVRPTRTTSVVAPAANADPFLTRKVQYSSAVRPGEPELQKRAPRAGSPAAWFQEYERFDLEPLQDLQATILAPDGDEDQQIGYLRALLARGPVASRQAFLAAARMPDKTVSNYAVARMTRGATELEFRTTLRQLAFEREYPVSARLRGQAVAALVHHAAEGEHQEIHGHLWQEVDPYVLQSALSAASTSSREIQLALGDLDPTGELVRMAEKPSRTFPRTEREALSFEAHHN